MASKKLKDKKDAKELTPEEKKAKADALALKAEEARKKKQTANRNHIQELKDIEEKYSKENLQKIHDKWRKIMRAAKTAELHKDIEAISECYDHEVKRKDRMIGNMMEQLYQAEKQRELAFSKHVSILDGLMDTHRTRMKNMEDEFQANVQRLKDSFEMERQQITIAHEKQKKELNDMVHAMENECKEAENDLRQEYEASREEIKNKNTEEYNVLKISLERSIEGLESRIEETHQAYLESTESKTQAFKRMMEKDKITAQLIEQRMRKLLHLHENIAYKRAKIATNSREWDSRNKAMRDQKDSMNKHYQVLKRKISKLRIDAHQELKAISKLSEEVQEDLRKKLNTAENILKLGDVNSKLELEQEKIFPFDPLHLSSLPPMRVNLMSSKPDSVEEKGPNQEDMKDGNKDEHPELGKPQVILVTNETGQEVEEFEYLSRFHNKFNKVMLDKMALDTQKKSLTSQVEKLKTSLKQIAEGLNGCDDLMTRKLRALLNQDQPAKKVGPGVIDDILRMMRRSMLNDASKPQALLV